jgi:DNA-binding beta-propeller fold protein YncE
MNERKTQSAGVLLLLFLLLSAFLPAAAVAAEAAAPVFGTEGGPPPSSPLPEAGGPGQEDIVEETIGSESAAPANDDSPAADAGAQFEELGQPVGLEPVKVLSIFSSDIYGNKISFPKSFFYDAYRDEVYVIKGGPDIDTAVTIYDNSYFPVSAFGAGRGVINASGLVVDREGNIFVAMGGGITRDGRGMPAMIRVLNPALFTLREIHLNSIKGLKETFKPNNIAIGADQDTLYLTSKNRKSGILVLDKEGNFKRWLFPLKTRGGLEGVGNDPDAGDRIDVEDVTVDARGRLYILTSRHGRVYVLDRDENFLFAFGKLGGTTGKMSVPRGIAVDARRKALFIVDYMRHNVNVHDWDDGSFLFEIGGMGAGPGWFLHPTDVVLDRRGNMFIADYFNHRVQVLEVK